MIFPMDNKTILVGLTGGIGAGKSTVAKLLQEQGFPVLSADILAREVVAPGSAALQEIVKYFGAELLQSDGSLDRKALREIIFDNAEKRKNLESITHPKIQALMLVKAQELFQKGNSLLFYEAPLLFEANSETRLSAVACVWAHDSVRVKRIMERDQCSNAEAEKILQSQMPQYEKKIRSDFLIENSDGLQELREKISPFLESVKLKFSLPTS